MVKIVMELKCHGLHYNEIPPPGVNAAANHNTNNTKKRQHESSCIGTDVINNLEELYLSAVNLIGISSESSQALGLVVDGGVHYYVIGDIEICVLCSCSGLPNATNY